MLQALGRAALTQGLVIIGLQAASSLARAGAALIVGGSPVNIISRLRHARGAVRIDGL